MCSEALNKESHCDDEPDTHEEDGVPVGLEHGNMLAQLRLFDTLLTVTHWAMVNKVLWLNKRFFSLTRGPSAST